MTDRDSRAASSATSPARLPTPESGLGSHELVTESDDPAVLRHSLLRAKERLAFYESFDRIIGENIKRSGELMLETIALREEAQAAEQARITRESQIEAERQAERARTKALLSDLHGEIARFQTGAAALLARVNDALRALEPDESEDAIPESPVSASAPSAGSAPVPGAPPVSAPAPETDRDPDLPPPAGETPNPSFRPIRHTAATTTMAVAVVEDDGDGEAPDGEPLPAESPREAEGRRIDVVVNGITRAATALAFQRALSGRDGVANVETREFAEGVLRLKVDITGDRALSDELFAAWPGPGHVQVLTRQPGLIALEISES